MISLSELGEKLKKEREAEEAKKLAEEINAAINKVKAAEKYLEEVKREFKEKYPKEYELNFVPDSDKTMSEEEYKKLTSETRDNSKSIAISYEDNGKDEPKVSARVNGKKVDNASLDELFKDKEIYNLAKMLGIV